MKTQTEQEIIAYNKKFHEVKRKCYWWMTYVSLPLTILAAIIAYIAFNSMEFPTTGFRIEFAWGLMVFTPIVIVLYLCSRHCRKKGLIPCKPKKYLAPKKQSRIEALYENNLKPKLEVLEKQRKIIHDKLTFWKRVFFLLTIVIWAVLFTNVINSLHGDERILAIIFLIVIPPTVSIVIYNIISFNIVKPYRKKFKAEIINAIVATVDESLTYYPQKNILFNDFIASGLFYAERVDGEDYVEGMLGNTAARFSEIRATYTVETEEGTETVTSYSGLFFVFDFNKAFEGRTVVVPQYQYNNNYGQLVKLESPEFEKMFAVYSDDQITARYVLSLSLMQRILSFSLQHRTIYLSFVNGILYVGIPSLGGSAVMGKVILPFFEPKISSTLLNFKLYRKEFIYLSFVKDIVEEFNLNRRIWSKGASLPVFSQDNLKKMIN